MKCPDCGATLKYKMRVLTRYTYIRDKRCKKSHVIRSLVCSTCGYAKPSLEVRC